MSHFISASCEGNICVCGKPATHKLGEEIMSDEPCMACGKPYSDGLAKTTCTAMFHTVGPGGQRHNLTAYVCCFHQTLILGPATGCPLTDVEKHALAAHQYAFGEVKDPGFGPPNDTLCLACGGKLVAIDKNTTGTIIFLDCENCGSGSEAPYRVKG